MDTIQPTHSVARVCPVAPNLMEFSLSFSVLIHQFFILREGQINLNIPNRVKLGCGCQQIFGNSFACLKKSFVYDILIPLSVLLRYVSGSVNSRHNLGTLTGTPIRSSRKCYYLCPISLDLGGIII